MNENIKHRYYFDPQNFTVNGLKWFTDKETNKNDYPQAESIIKKIPVYLGDSMRQALKSKDSARRMSSELIRCLYSGPGVFAISGAYSDLNILDAVAESFYGLIQGEKDNTGQKGDHFGTNERLWNSLQKLCVASPELAYDYYGNPILDLVCKSWLGPGYQMTAQVNIVNPGGKAQVPHRDYHLGFQGKEILEGFPAHIQVISQYMTLQGAVAHTDMPLETGPTLLLPYSQNYEPGYMAFREEAFLQFFEENYVQLPLKKGDAVFFSPALFHGAGTNKAEKPRVANLLQISSAFGKTMESLNHAAMVEATYETMLKEKDPANSERLNTFLASVCDDYSFPTNLDSDPPIGGNAPKTMKKIVLECLIAKKSKAEVLTELENYKLRRQA